jgi:hypothetical protein
MTNMTGGCLFGQVRYAAAARTVDSIPNPNSPDLITQKPTSSAIFRQRSTRHKNGAVAATRTAICFENIDESHVSGR